MFGLCLPSTTGRSNRNQFQTETCPYPRTVDSYVQLTSGSDLVLLLTTDRDLNEALCHNGYVFYNFDIHRLGGGHTRVSVR